ncbi:MAG: bifunctional glutamate N-acetyltransferase/amino-acid acetyltransferase ArgJ [Cytophagales bacterium]|nr:bifunctional glutamate N-acetyltransferase/amino-acid acetyltransferase ArgJ [Armatimonadota bacterium]
MALDERAAPPWRLATADAPYAVVEGGVCAAHGFAVAGVRCGIKRKRRDVALLACTTGWDAICAGVFTQNVLRAPSVDRNIALLRKSPSARAVIVNAGNANAGNGRQGEDDNAAMAAMAAAALGVSANAILTASTGVIGTALPMELLRVGIADAGRGLASTPEAAANAAEAILTTDTFEKQFAVCFSLPESGTEIRIGGMSKGSGMIAPNMATMLAFLTTDAVLSPPLLDRALRAAVEVSFNCLTVDGDTSTNDSCVILASGAAGNPVIAEMGSDYASFVDALTQVCIHLAREVARDGEGATKLVTVRVSGAPTRTAARQVAKTIAESPLVKTALFGNDPNWGRILAAAGRAGVPFDPHRATADLAGVRIFAQGTPTRFDGPTLSQAMAAREVEIAVDLGGDGDGSATVYTCDFSYDYVRINAEYHT